MATHTSSSLKYCTKLQYHKASWCFMLSLLLTIQPTVIADTFQDNFIVTWGFDHVTASADGQALWLMLDNSSGSSMASKKSYLFGSVSMQIKLVPGNSAGVVTAYYMASSNANIRDELDFEFLGNTSGEPYILQTNVYTHGIGGREQRINLWFDPTEDFHAYSFLWNKNQTMFLVDDVPIRVFKNIEKEGVPYLNSQAMGIYSSIWNGDEWATQGGRVKIDWADAPFVASYRGFNVDACEQGQSQCPGSSWWSQDPYTSLSPSQLSNLQKVKQNYMVYDYCLDSSRYPTTPIECALNS
eukprot:c15700_g1_i1 orf=463-1356(-)